MNKRCTWPDFTPEEMERLAHQMAARQGCDITLARSIRYSIEDGTISPRQGAELRSHALRLRALRRERQGA